MDMQFSKTYGVVGNFHQNQDSSGQHVHTKVLLVDGSPEERGSQLYMLSPETVIEENNLQALKHKFIAGLHDGTFLHAGEMTSLNRDTKTAKVSNNNVVSYDHLIVITGAKNFRALPNGEQQYYNGLMTLVDALRIHRQQLAIGLSLKTPFKIHNKPHTFHAKTQQCSLSYPKFTLPATQTLSDWLIESDVRICQVQL